MSYDPSPWCRSLKHYLAWLRRTDALRATSFSNRLRNDDSATVEGAVAEALVWNFLDDREIEIKSGESASGGPDFMCNARGSSFLVEVTNISRDTASAVTGLDDLELEAGGYATLSRQVKSEVQRKAEQLGSLKCDIPIVVFVTTLHWQASILAIQRDHIEELLTAECYITGDIDNKRGEVIGPLYSSTRMEHAVFTKTHSLVPTRRHISAVVVAGFRVCPPVIRPEVSAFGALAPAPLVPFDPSLLIDVDFCRYRVWPPIREIQVEWSTFQREPRRRPLAPKLLQYIDKREAKERDRKFESDLAFWSGRQLGS